MDEEPKSTDIVTVHAGTNDLSKPATVEESWAELDAMCSKLLEDLCGEGAVSLGIRLKDDVK